MRNISAVFESLKLSIIKGYLPAKNVGKGKRGEKEIIEIINEKNIFNDLFSPTVDNIEFENNIQTIMLLNNKEQPIGIKNPEKRKQEVTLFFT
jgi:hypothetical protein